MFGWLFGPRASATQHSGSDILIVRRNLSPAFYFYCRMFAKENGVTVVPDRRVNDRRRRQRATPTIDRRNFDRRDPSSDGWQGGEFMILRAKPRRPPES
jgi:hypothetical protein